MIRHPVPVTVEYALTPLGESLQGLMLWLKDWAEAHIGETHAARDDYDARSGQ